MKSLPGKVAVLLTALFAANLAAAETIELVTYYPSSGTNEVDTDRLHAGRATVGEPYSLLNPADADLPDGTLLVAGSVGIGPNFETIAPTQVLEVEGNVLANSPATALMMADRGANANFSGLQLLTAGAAQWTIGSRNNATEHLAIFSDANNVVRMLIEQGTGNVAIGAGAPRSRLDVQGSMGLGVTIANGNLVLDGTHNVVLTNGAGNITVTLPAPANLNGRTYYIKKTDGDADTVTINAAGGALIDGSASLTLFVQGDAVRVICDGGNWHVISDEIQPHRAKLTRNTAQSIPHASNTKINLNAEEYDVGFIGDPAAGRIVISRSGTYLLTAFWRQTISASTQTYIDILRNGSIVAQSLQWDSQGGNGDTCFISDTQSLQANDILEIAVYHSAGGARNTSTTELEKPRLSVVEIR